MRFSTRNRLCETSVEAIQEYVATWSTLIVVFGIAGTITTMEYILPVGVVALIHLLAVMSPGPDFVVALKNSLMYSRRTGIWTAVGFGLGISVHIFYSAIGLAVVVSQSIVLFSILKYLGAAYLIYIGIKSLMAGTQPVDVGQEQKIADITPRAAAKIGFLTNVLNPKATLFFLSLFTLVIAPGTPVLVLGIMSLVMVINTALWFSLVAIFFTQKRVQDQFNKFQGVFNKVLGGMLIALGVKIALTQK